MENKLSRRDFIRNTALGILGAGIAGKAFPVAAVGKYLTPRKEHKGTSDLNEEGKMKEEMLTLCGYRCDLCPFYTKNIKSEEDKEKLCREFNQLFGYNLQPATVECVGCLNEGKHLARNCPVRSCALEKSVENCAHCDDFICDKLKKNIDFADDLLKRKKQDLSNEQYAKFIEPYKARERLLKIREEMK